MCGGASEISVLSVVHLGIGTAFTLQFSGVRLPLYSEPLGVLHKAFALASVWVRASILLNGACVVHESKSSKPCQFRFWGLSYCPIRFLLPIHLEAGVPANLHTGHRAERSGVERRGADSGAGSVGSQERRSHLRAF